MGSTNDWQDHVEVQLAAILVAVRGVAKELAQLRKLVEPDRHDNGGKKEPS